MEKVYELYIRTTPERLWQAITDPGIRSRYNFGAGQTSDWTPGSRYEMGAPKAAALLGEGVNLVVDPPRRLVQSMVALWSEDVKREGASRVTWEIHAIAADSCRLTVTHDQLRDGANEELYGGWPMILRPEDVARDGRGSHHARIPPLRLRSPLRSVSRGGSGRPLGRARRP